MTAGATAATSQGDLSVNGDPSSVPVGAIPRAAKVGGATVLGLSKDFPSIKRPRNPHSCLGLWQTQASTFKDAGGKFLRTIEEQTGIVKVRKYHCRGLIIDADGFSHWASKGTNPRAISRRPRKAKAGVTYIYSAPLLSLTLTMFGQALSSRPENPFSFPTRDSDGVVSDQPCPSAMRPLLLRIRMGPHVF
jgi:hypothetical protein